MADKVQGTISAQWNGAGAVVAGSTVSIPGWSNKGITVGDVRQDGTIGIQVVGSMTATLLFEGSIDGTNYFPLAGYPAQGVVGTHVTSVTAAGQWLIDCEGVPHVRVRCSAYTSGTPVVTLFASMAGLSTSTSGAIIAPDNYTNITTNTTTVVKSGVGVLHAIVFNTPVATGVITIWDNTAASGTKIGTVTVPASPQPNVLVYGIQFNTGLTIQTATAAQDLTIVWR